MPGSADKPVIEYPCSWTYKVIGQSEDDLRRAVPIMLDVCLDRGSGDRPYTLALSRTSGKGKWVSLKLTLEVVSEAERDALFAGLKDCPEVQLVL